MLFYWRLRAQALISWLPMELIFVIHRTCRILWGQCVSTMALVHSAGFAPQVNSKIWIIQTSWQRMFYPRLQKRHRPRFNHNSQIISTGSKRQKLTNWWLDQRREFFTQTLKEE